MEPHILLPRFSSDPTLELWTPEQFPETTEDHEDAKEVNEDIDNDCTMDDEWGLETDPAPMPELQ
jgi:hypothetical protein